MNAEIIQCKIQKLLRNSLDKDYGMHQIAFEACEWDPLYDIFMQQKLFPLGYSLLKESIPPEHKKKWITAHLILHLIIDRRMADITSIQNLLAENGIPSYLTKGIALSQFIYNTPYMRQSNDIDIFVKSTDLRAAFYCLYEHGYPFEPFMQVPNESYLDIEKYITSAYELVFYPLKGEHYKIEIKSADKNAFIQDDLMNIIDNNPTVLSVHGSKISCVDNVFGLFYLFTNAYKNNFLPWAQFNSRNLRDLYDIAYWIKNNPEHDFSHLNTIINKSHVASQFNDILSLTYSIFGNTKTHSVSSNELRKIIDCEYRHRECYRHMMNHFTPHICHKTEKNAMIEIPMDEVLPVKNNILKAYAYRNSYDQILFSIFDIPLYNEICIQFVLYDKTENDLLKQRKSIYINAISNNITAISSELDYVSTPAIYKNCITLFIPICDRFVHLAADRSSILFECHVSWVHPSNHIWMEIGGAHQPHELVIG